MAVGILTCSAAHLAVAKPADETRTTPCCGHEYKLSQMPYGPIFWNPYRSPGGAVQCHMCYAVFEQVKNGEAQEETKGS